MRASRAEVILAVSLEPTERRPAREDLGVMLGAQANPGPQAPARGRGPLPGPRGEGWLRGSGAGAHGWSGSLPGCERAAHDALAGALGQLDELLGALVLGRLACAGVRAAGAVVLACLGDAVALLGVVVVRRIRHRRQHEEAADSCGEDHGLRGHVSLLLLVMKLPGAFQARARAPTHGARVVPSESPDGIQAVRQLRLASFVQTPQCTAAILRGAAAGCGHAPSRQQVVAVCREAHGAVEIALDGLPHGVLIVLHGGGQVAQQEAAYARVPGQLTDGARWCMQ